MGHAEAGAVCAAFPATFGGQAVDDSSVLVGLTRYGDTNLDGIVNLQDFNRLAANFGLSVACPDVTPQDWSVLGSAVPEPASALLAAPALQALLWRLRSHGTR